MSALTLKILGSCLLVLGGALLSCSGVRARRCEVKTLRALSAALGIFEGELAALAAPLPDIFAKLRSTPFFAMLSAGFGTEPTEQLWRRAAGTLGLDDDCAAALADLGAVVGRYDALRQAGEIAAVRHRLNDRAAVIERQISERGRRLPGLGAAIGAMAAVLLF